MAIDTFFGQTYTAAQLEEQKNNALEKIQNLDSILNDDQMAHLEDWIESFFNSYIEPDMDELIQEDPQLTNNTKIQELLENPELLLEEPQYIDTPSLTTEPSDELIYGQLTQDSKDQVNALITDLSQELQVEVHASVATKEDGMSRLKLTAGTSNSVSYTIPAGSVYSAHTHLSGILHPTPTDLRNNVPYAEDAVVVNGEGLVYA